MKKQSKFQEATCDQYMKKFTEKLHEQVTGKRLKEVSPGLALRAGAARLGRAVATRGAKTPGTSAGHAMQGLGNIGRGIAKIPGIGARATNAGSNMAGVSGAALGVGRALGKIPKPKFGPVVPATRVG